MHYLAKITIKKPIKGNHSTKTIISLDVTNQDRIREQEPRQSATSLRNRSVLNFESITSIEGGAHTHFVDTSNVHTTIK